MKFQFKSVTALLGIGLMTLLQASIMYEVKEEHEIAIYIRIVCYL